MAWLARAGAALAGAAICTLFPVVASARPYTIDDLLRLEVFAGLEGTPDGRFLIIHTYGPAASAGRFGDDGWPQPELSRLYRVDVDKPSPASLIYPVTAGQGVLPGPMAPASDQMIVYRLAGLRWRAGVLNLRSLRTRWTTLCPELALYGRTVQWVDDETVAAIAVADGQAPSRIAMSWRTRQERAAAWERTAQGTSPAFRIMGSGAASQWGRPPPLHRLQLRNLSTGEARTLATGDFLDMEISPDGRFAALLEEKEAVPPAEGATVKVGTPARRRSLRLIDLRSGASTSPCPELTLYSHILSWSPHGDELLVSGSLDDGVVLARVEAVEGRCTPLAAPNLKPVVSESSEGIPFVHAGWLGGSPTAYLHRADAPLDRADWYQWSDQQVVNLTGDLDHVPAAAVRLDADGLVLADPPAGLQRYSADGGHNLISGSAGGEILRNRDLSEGARLGENPPVPNRSIVIGSAKTWMQRFGSPNEFSAGEPLWADARAAVIAVSDCHGSTRLVLTTGGTFNTVFKINSFLQDVDPPAVRSVSYETASGKPALGWLYLPPGSRQRPPLVVIPYPGATFAQAPQATALGQADFALGVQVLVGAGYAVLEPSLPTDPLATNPAESLTTTILAATDAAIATGAVDGERLALFGHSFGGYAALVAATQTDRFKAVVAYASLSNLTASWGTINPLFSEHPTFDGVINALTGWSDGGRGHLWASPWTSPDRYLLNSPFFQADKITAPTLLISADHDFAPLSQSEALFSALYRLHRNAALLSFEGEGHVVSSPANLRVLFAQVEGWLGAHLSSNVQPPELRSHPPADHRRTQASVATN